MLAPGSQDGKAAATDKDEGVSPSDAQDKAALAALGVETVFKREFTLWTCSSFALSISGLYPSIMTTFYYPLLAGGGACAIWAWLVAGAGALSLALSSAEIISAYPTAGAMYFTLRFLAPAEHVPIVSWVDGWISLVGQICGIASSEYSASQMLLSAVSIGSGFTYFPNQHHLIATMAALTVFHATINSLSTAWLNRLTNAYSVFHITALVAVCVTLLVMQKDKHTAAYSFTNIEPSSGWEPPGFSFLFGFISAAWTMTNGAATGHLAEETKDPSRTVPWAIVFANVFTYVGGFLFNIVLVFCMGDPKALLSSRVGQPVAQLVYNVTGSAGAICFMLAAFVIMNFVCVTALQAGSRMVFAFSRDDMLPLSHLWRRIWKRSDTPLPAVWLCASLCILIGLIGLGSQVAVAAIFSICAICHNVAYCVPIAYKHLYGRFRRGPWHMGAIGLPIDIFSILWSTFVSVVLMFPTVRPVTSENVTAGVYFFVFKIPAVSEDAMNYASLIIASFLLISLGYWFARGRHEYVGPRVHNLAGPVLVNGGSAALPSRIASAGAGV